VRFAADFFLVICVAIVAGCVVYETAQVRGTRDGWDDIGRVDAIAAIRTFLTFFLDRDIEAESRRAGGNRAA
jgi:uncharacterized membrane protein